MSAGSEAAARPNVLSWNVLGARPWRPASRAEIAVLICYFFVIEALADVFNVRLGVELMALAVLLPALLITRNVVSFLHDWWFLLVGLVMWNLSGPIAAYSPFHTHLDFLMQADRAILFGRDPVVVVQHSLAPASGIGALDWLTAIAYNMHLQEPYIVGYLLWRINRTVFLQFAAAVLILLVLGLITFILFPAVPPWLAAQDGKIPYVTSRFGPILNAHPLPFHGTPIFYLFQFRGDRVAAFPSEHCAFPMLELIAMGLACGKRVAALWSLWVLAVLFSVLYLGQHWVIDAIAGYLYAGAIFGFIILFCRYRPRPVPFARDLPVA